MRREARYTSRALRPSSWLLALRIAALVALAASAALFVDYISAQPAFCGAGSGCAAIRHSGYGYLPVAETAIPVPAFGLLGFATLFGATLLNDRVLRRRAVVLLGWVGAVTALVLLSIQFALGALCSLCFTADFAAIFGLVCALGYSRTSVRAATAGAHGAPRLTRWAWVALGVLAVFSPFLWARVRPLAPVPEAVRALYRPGKVNVVEFADFECPFCRNLHGRLKPLLGPYKDHLNFTRLNFPLESHEFARGAARAAVCAAAQGQADAMADALFTSEDLSVAGNRQTAARLGLDMARYDQCLNDPATDRTIDGQSKLLRDNGFQGLPTTFVGDRQIVGAQPDDVFIDALDRAERNEPERHLGGLPFALLVAGAAVSVLALGRAPKAREKAREGDGGPEAGSGSGTSQTAA